MRISKAACYLDLISRLELLLELRLQTHSKIASCVFKFGLGLTLEFVIFKFTIPFLEINFANPVNKNKIITT
jgi:hypothetical protein